MDTTALIPDQIKQQLNHFFTQVQQLDPQARMILFGSYAKGTATPQSDIDVCVVTDAYQQNYHDGTITLMRIAHQFPHPMDVIPYSSIDLANKYDPLAKEIRTTGVQWS